MARKGRRATHEERICAIRMLEAGQSAESVADILGVSRASVFEWQRKYREGGLSALLTKFASGRPTVLSDQQMLQLYTLIAGKDPRQYSFGFALWTRSMVADLIEHRFGVRLSRVTVGRILKKLGMSPQRPLYRAYQQDPERVREWKQTIYPQIHAEAAQVGARIFFADEAGIRTDHHAGTTWAPVGQTPVVKATGARHSVNMVSAISPRGELHFQLFEGNMNALRFIEFCQRLLADVTTPVFLIVDGSRAHTATIVRQYVESTHGRLRLYILPPYSPQLNPDEWVWNNVKHQVKRAVAMGKSHLYTLARDALEQLHKTPHIVRSFFADPDLAYIPKVA